MPRAPQGRVRLLEFRLMGTCFGAKFDFWGSFGCLWYTFGMSWALSSTTCNTIASRKNGVCSLLQFCLKGSVCYVKGHVLGSFEDVPLSFDIRNVYFRYVYIVTYGDTRWEHLTIGIRRDQKPFTLILHKLTHPHHPTLPPQP